MNRRRCAILLFVGVSASILAQERPGVISEFGRLEAFVGRDLRLVRADQDAVREMLSEFTKPTEDGVDYGLRPWWVSRVDSGCRAHWIVLEGYPGKDIPDVSLVRAHLFDVGWLHMGSHLWPTGYRMFIRDAVLVKEATLGRDLIAIRTYGTGFLKDKEDRQFYAILDDRVAMVRLEDGDGRLIRKSYHQGAPFLGPPVLDRTFEQWTDALHSTDPVEVLEALVWLSGGHKSSTAERSADSYEESVEHSKVFEAVRGWAVSDTLVNVHWRSNPWVDEGIELVFRRESPDLGGAGIDLLVKRSMIFAASIAVAVAVLFLVRRSRSSRRESVSGPLRRKR